jgi:hypothetical protein
VDSVPAGTVCFSIQAAAEPGVMPRVIELFAKRNLVPERWVSGVHNLAERGPSDRGMADRGAELMIDLQVAGLTRQDRDYLTRCLAQITDVRSVLTSEKAGA